MTLDFADYTKASNLVHAVQGGALLLLGAAEAYALDNKGRKVPLAGAAVLALSGAATFLALLALPGGWSFGQLAAALNFRRGFYLFVAFACVYTGAGLCRLTQAALDRRDGGWQAMFLALLAFAGVLYFLLASRVNEEAWRQVLVLHSAIGATLLLAVAARAAAIFRPRRWLSFAWAALLLVTGMQLLTYRETQGAFAPRLVTMQSQPDAPRAQPAKNAPADKKRPSR